MYTECAVGPRPAASHSESSVLYCRILLQTLFCLFVLFQVVLFCFVLFIVKVLFTLQGA